jgi:hypothetical protein
MADVFISRRLRGGELRAAEPAEKKENEAPRRVPRCKFHTKTV